MKYIKSILFVTNLCLLSLLIGCTESDSRFGDQPETGWVEFDGNGTTVNPEFSTLAVPIEINVPIFQNGIEIGYELEAVTGDYTQFVTNPGSTVFESPEDSDKVAFIELGLNNLTGLTQQVVFDVVITSTSIEDVSIGIDENSPTSYRVTIPCTNPEFLPDDYFVGEYTITDVEATIGPGNGTSNFEAGTVTLSADPFNPNVRLFDSPAVPAFTGGTPFSFSLLFSTDNTVTLQNFVGLGISCDGATEYGFGPANSAVSWDICNDNSITITYEEDPGGSCGGPFVSSFSLVKN
jgi:hypothetical protein